MTSSNSSAVILIQAKGPKDDTNKDRHSTGSFYTPEAITRYNASRAISARALEMAVGTKGRYISIEDILSSAPVRALKGFYFTVLCEIKILDPACGDGAFLLACLDVLTGLRQRCLSILEYRRSKDRKVLAEVRAMSRGQLGLRVLRDNIYGLDLDTDAMRSCRKNLLKAATEGIKKAPSSKMSKAATTDIRHGNALLGHITPPQQATLDIFHAVPSRRTSKKDRRSTDDKYLSHLVTKVSKETMDLLEDTHLFHWYDEFPEVFGRGGFDVVIGNPPYGDRALSKEEREVVKALYPFGTTVTDSRGKGSVNPSSVFIERSYGLMTEGGQLSLILPSSITRVQEFEKTRRFLLDRTHLWHMVDEGAPFKGITLEMFSMFARKGGSPPGESTTVVSRREGYEGKEWAVPLTVFEHHDRFMLYWDPAYDKICEQAILGGLSGRRGPTIPDNRYKKVKDGLYKIPLLISGKAIQRYRLVPSEFHWAQEGLKDLPGAKALMGSTLLIGTRLKDHYRVCIKPPGYAVADNVIRLDFESRIITPMALAVLLNSKLMRYVVRYYLFNNSSLTLFIQSVAGATPVRPPVEMELFTRVGNEMHELGKAWPESKGRMEDMDRLVANPLVYELYLYGTRGLGLAKRLAALEPDRLLTRARNSDEIGNILDSIYSNPIVRRIERD